MSHVNFVKYTESYLIDAGMIILLSCMGNPLCIKSQLTLGSTVLQLLAMLICLAIFCHSSL